jgi:hypothetical protein
MVARSLVGSQLVVSDSHCVQTRLGSSSSIDLADIIGVYNVTLVCGFVMAVMAFVWLACDTMVSCIVLVIIMGIAGGAFVSLQAPLAIKTATDMRFGGTMVGQALCELARSALVVTK